MRSRPPCTSSTASKQPLPATLGGRTAPLFFGSSIPGAFLPMGRHSRAFLRHSRAGGNPVAFTPCLSYRFSSGKRRISAHAAHCYAPAKYIAATGNRGSYGQSSLEDAISLAPAVRVTRKYICQRLRGGRLLPQMPERFQRAIAPAASAFAQSGPQADTCDGEASQEKCRPDAHFLPPMP